MTALETEVNDRLDSWAEFRFEAEEYRELDDERVLVLVRASGRGRTSGLELGELRTQGAHVFHVRDRQVTRLVFYGDRERALADLDLAADAASSPMQSSDPGS